MYVTVLVFELLRFMKGIAIMDWTQAAISGIMSYNVKRKYFLHVCIMILVPAFHGASVRKMI